MTLVLNLTVMLYLAKNVLDVEVRSGLVVAYRKRSIFSKSLSIWTALVISFCILRLCSCPAYPVCTCMRCAFASQMQIFGFLFPQCWKIHGGHIVTDFSYHSF